MSLFQGHLQYVIRLCCFGLFAISLSSQAATSVWKVSKGKHYFYLAGTMHVLKADDYPLPAEFEKAYNDASQLVFEVDLSNPDMSLYQQRLVAKDFYPEGKNLQDILTPNAWQALEDYCKRRQLQPEHFINMPTLISQKSK